MGTHFINDTGVDRFDIQSLILHEEYDNEFFLNDIALIKLSRKVNLKDSRIGVICLPPRNVPNYPVDGTKSTAIGWGSLEYNGDLSYTLQQVDLPIISNQNEFCANQVYDRRIQFCAGLIEGGKDTCGGDR